MPVRNAKAVWNGTLREGEGTMALGSGAFVGRYTFASRFEEAAGTNPEELIAAAQAGCFSMKLSGSLTRAGYPPTSIETTARVRIEGGKIDLIELDTEAAVAGIDEPTFQQEAEKAKVECPVGALLSKGTEIRLTARLRS